MPVIPEKNPISMIAYYLGIFSLIPCLGAVLSLPAIICGIIGMVNANKQPEVGGQGHALTGLLLGLFGQAIIGGILYAVMLAMSGP